MEPMESDDFANYDGVGVSGSSGEQEGVQEGAQEGEHDGWSSKGQVLEESLGYDVDDGLGGFGETTYGDRDGGGDSGSGAGAGAGDGSGGTYTVESSKALEVSLASARALVDPLTKLIPWEHLPKTDRNYNFGPEFLSYLSLPVRLRILIEHRMGWGGAGHCRRLKHATANHLEARFGYALGLWETSGDNRDLSKHRNPSGYEDKEILDVDADPVLKQWLGHYRKYLDKQAKKLGRVGVNLANIPYTAGPGDIKKAVVELLEWSGCVSAIDPWWQKQAWNHDGTVTVFMPKVAANDLVTRCEQGLLILRPPRGPSNPRVIKAWFAKPRGAGDGVDSSNTNQVSQSLDSWQ